MRRLYDFVIVYFYGCFFSTCFQTGENPFKNYFCFYGHSVQVYETALSERCDGKVTYSLHVSTS